MQEITRNSVPGISCEQFASVETRSATETGPVRMHNEDSIAVVNLADYGSPEKGTILVVADGMGGMDAGECASSMVTDELPFLYLESENSNPVACLVQSVQQINRRVHKAGGTTGSRRGMGTTAVIAAIVNHSLITVNVGDSRAYLFRDGKLNQLSRDHSMRREFFNPHEIRGRDFSHVLTQAIGPQADVTPHVNVISIKNQDMVLLCSDGLTSAVSDLEIEGILNSTPFTQVVTTLLEKAIDNKTDDNISIILSRLVSVPPVNVIFECER